MIEPLGYLDFLCLTAHAALVITDSGGIQEETTYLGVHCLTARPNTERPITITLGTNRLVGSKAPDIIAAAQAALRRKRPAVANRVPLWDGQTAPRIIDTLIMESVKDRA